MMSIGGRNPDQASRWFRLCHCGARAVVNPRKPESTFWFSGVPNDTRIATSAVSALFDTLLWFAYVFLYL